MTENAASFTGNIPEHYDDGLGPILFVDYADDIARLAPAAPGWARQMRIFILGDMGEPESAKVLLGGLLVSGEIKDERDFRFLAERLKDMNNGEKSSHPSKK